MTAVQARRELGVFTQVAPGHTAVIGSRDLEISVHNTLPKPRLTMTCSETSVDIRRIALVRFTYDRRGVTSDRVDNKVFLGDRGSDNATPPMPDAAPTPMLLWSEAFVEQFADDILSARDAINAYTVARVQDDPLTLHQCRRRRSPGHPGSVAVAGSISTFSNVAGAGSIATFGSAAATGSAVTALSLAMCGCAACLACVACRRCRAFSQCEACVGCVGCHNCSGLRNAVGLRDVRAPVAA